MKKFWEFRNQAGSDTAELLLYGDISNETWYGDEVTPRQFDNDLKALGNVEEIIVRCNSAGGDVFAAFAIGNALKNHPAHVTARIEGCCCSAATIIASLCDTVQADTGAIYMIHPVKMGLCGYMDAVTLQQYVAALGAIRENIVDLYAAKTGRTKDEVGGWMDATSWWTPAQALENGFIDEVLDNEAGSVIENRNGIVFVNSVSLNTSVENAPEFVQKRLAEHPASEVADKTPKNVKEEAEMDIKTVDDLRKAYPELVDQIGQEAAAEATNAERERIKGIEDAALPGSEALAAQAKFEKPMSVSDFAVALVKNAKDQGATYLEQAKQDAKNSGVNSVRNIPPDGMGRGDVFMDAIKGLSRKE